jgi:hypothetical protein
MHLLTPSPSDNNVSGVAPSVKQLTKNGMNAKSLQFNCSELGRRPMKPGLSETGMPVSEKPAGVRLSLQMRSDSAILNADELHLL